VFRSAKPKSRGMRRREEEMDTDAVQSGGADPELFATMRALTTYVQTMRVDQRRTDHFLQAVAEQQQQNHQELHDRVTWRITLRAVQTSAAKVDALICP
jgi:hypothetical protein